MSLVSSLIPQFVARELDRPLIPSAHEYHLLEELRSTATEDSSRAVCVVYAEENVTAELDNLIDTLQDDDMRQGEREIAAANFLARAIVLVDAVGTDKLLLVSSLDALTMESVGELKKIADFGPSRETAGLYDVETEAETIALTADQRRAWNDGSSVDDKLKNVREIIDNLKG